jgi:hypothetical protein
MAGRPRDQKPPHWLGGGGRRTAARAARWRGGGGGGGPAGLVPRTELLARAGTVSTRLLLGFPRRAEPLPALPASAGSHWTVHLACRGPAGCTRRIPCLSGHAALMAGPDSWTLRPSRSRCRQSTGLRAACLLLLAKQAGLPPPLPLLDASWPGLSFPLSWGCGFPSHPSLYPVLACLPALRPKRPRVGSSPLALSQ